MVLAYSFRYGLKWHAPSGSSFLTFVAPLAASLALWVLIFSRMKLDGFSRGWQLSATLSQLFVAVSLVMLIALALGYLSRIFISRLTLTYFGALLYAGFVAIRFTAHAILGSTYFVRASRRILIVGNGAIARELALKFERHPELLCEVVGFLSSADSSLDTRLPCITGETTVLQTLAVIDLLRRYRVDEVILALSTSGAPEVMNLASQCRREGIAVSIVPHPYELYLSRPQLLDIGGLPVVQLHNARSTVRSPVWKRAFDILAGATLLVITAPIMAISILALLRKRDGPFKREPRCGQFGRIFMMWRLNSERNSTSLPKHEILLQQLSITELPQLLNVLRGDMTLVGPRPESPERVKHYSDWQRERLNAKPGMTGLAQVQGVREQHSSDDKTRFDLQYMLDSSLFVDLALLLQTFWTLALRVAHLCKLGLPKREPEVGLVQQPQAGLLSETLPNAHSAQSSAD